ncbi:MAG: 16S rRNA (uracil(1498)-N(3))-methyltransferase [Bacteroidetes bacterium]|nr:16S rRNA (uracil(1498)-N(3))-methyltransferase [Bacteroidota bacterium]MBS1973821.1 16S rRNA (uracil(1498)-N(3))-methyltransferase [Bacteroidota bacterium]
MQAPLFYIEEFQQDEKFIVLNEETSKHIVQVLRMKAGENLLLTNGKGSLADCEIIDGHRKKCTVKILKKSFEEQRARKISIGISILKNASRFEWFLEKSAELGVNEIIPLICQRTEKQHFRHDRMNSILISAMLQSQQVWLPVLRELTAFKEIVAESHQSQKFIAHCLEETKASVTDAANPSTSSQIILIGPEGDFAQEEIFFAYQHHFIPVSLGNTRLRTETAGIVAATILSV